MILYWKTEPFLLMHKKKKKKKTNILIIKALPNHDDKLRNVAEALLISRRYYRLAGLIIVGSRTHTPLFL